MSLRFDYLDSVFELYTDDDFRQLVVAAQTIPAFLGGLCELEGARPDVVHRALHRRSSVAAPSQTAAPRQNRQARSMGQAWSAVLPRGAPFISFDNFRLSFDAISRSLLIS